LQKEENTYENVSAIIIDEAHSLEESITSAYKKSFSFYSAKIKIKNLLTELKSQKIMSTELGQNVESLEFYLQTLESRILEFIFAREYNHNSPYIYFNITDPYFFTEQSQEHIHSLTKTLTRIIASLEDPRWVQYQNYF
jgi:Rad3-related DNA helicase